jgi:hypothetical protein
MVDTAPIDAAIDPVRAAADDAWREGRLLAARDGYKAILSRDPNDWRARTALASMDLAFGKLSVDAARALSRDDLSRDAKDHVRSVVAAAEDRERDTLKGKEAAWDIEALRVAGKNADDTWWLKKGKAAWDVWLFGLAAACFDEANNRSESLSYNPPPWAQVTLSQADDYLRMLAGALP